MSLNICLSHILILFLLICSFRWMNLKQASLVGWEENLGAALDGFQLIMPRRYLRVKPQSACVQQHQAHPPQPSNQLPQHHQLLDTPPPQPLPPTVTGPILVPRKYLINACSGIHLLFLLFWLTPLCFYISSWPSNATNQSDSEGWDAWPTSSSASQNPSLSVPSAQLRQRSAFTPAAMTTGSSPSPVLGQVGSKTALLFVMLSSEKIQNCNFLSARVRKLRAYRLRPCIHGGQRKITTSTSTKMKYDFAHLFFNAGKKIILCWFNWVKCIVLVLTADNNGIGAAGYVVVRWAADWTERMVPQKLRQAHLYRGGTSCCYSNPQ